MSIKHFAALSAKRQKEFLDHPERFTHLEKLDGSQFIFGAVNGRLWAGRKTEAEKFWSPNEWPKQMWAQNFVEAHKAIDQMQTVILDSQFGLGQNFTCHAEILSRIYPNTILYQRWVNSIVVYQGEWFDGPFMTEFDSKIMTSFDGKTVNTKNIHEGYELSHMGYGLPCSQDLTEPWKDLPIEKVNDIMIREYTQVDSQYGNTRPEGVVFKHQDGWMFKIVDKEWFLSQNQANYAFRKKMFKTPGQKTDSIMDVYTRELLVDPKEAQRNALVRLNILHEWYFREGMLDEPDHIHQRNVEAMASLYQQLQTTESRWADELSTM